MAYIEFVDREGELRPANAPWRTEAALGDSAPSLPDYMKGRFDGLQEAADVATARGADSADAFDQQSDGAGEGIIEDVEAEEIVIEDVEVAEEAEEAEVVDSDGDGNHDGGSTDPKAGQ